MHKSLSERMRPKAFADLMQPDRIVRALEYMGANKSPVNMLLYGSPGLGKTSAARILLDLLGDNWWEINGSVQTGIDVVRDIVRSAGCAGLFDGPRVCFIDEADYLSPNAQAGLRGVIEQVGTICRFIMTANDISKFSPALMSRCIPICFDISVAERAGIIARVLPRYAERLRTLNVIVEEKRVEELFHIYFPDLRLVANTIEIENMGSPQIERGSPNAMLQLDDTA